MFLLILIAICIFIPVALIVTLWRWMRGPQVRRRRNRAALFMEGGSRRAEGREIRRARGFRETNNVFLEQGPQAQQRRQDGQATRSHTNNSPQIGRSTGGQLGSSRSGGSVGRSGGGRMGGGVGHSGGGHVGGGHSGGSHH